MSVNKTLISGAAFVLGLSFAASSAVAEDAAFSALKGVNATPMTAAEMDAVQGKNWFFSYEAFDPTAFSYMESFVNESSGAQLQVYLSGQGDTVEASGGGIDVDVVHP